MINPSLLEEAFKEFSLNFQKWVPDGVIDVNLNLLQELGLLKHIELEQTSTDDLMNYFHVIETPDKVTLFNEQFAVWIVPKMVNETPTTWTYVALIPKGQQPPLQPHLELVFSTEGVYNTPKFILKVLQHFLSEVVDTEAIISSIEKPKEPD